MVKQGDRVFRCRHWQDDLASAGQTCAIPPSTARSTPVMKLLSEQAKKRAVDAISSDRPKRARGTMLAIATRIPFTWSSGNPIFPMMGVSIGPGLRQLTRILRSFRSVVQVRANERTAALVPL